MQKPTTDIGLRKEAALRAVKNVRRQYAKWVVDDCDLSNRSETEWYVCLVFHSRDTQEQATLSGIDSILEDALHEEIKKESWEFDEPMRFTSIRFANMDDINAAGGFYNYFR
jgi:hypothetical protein